MANEESPPDSLSPETRARLRAIAALVQWATTEDGLRLAASELGRITELGDAESTLPPSPTFDLHLHIAPHEGFGSEAAPDPEADERDRTIREQLGPDALTRLQRMEPLILRRLEEDPEWAAEFAARPLSALERLDPPVDPRLLEALRQLGGGVDRGSIEGAVRVVEIDTARSGPEQEAE